MENIVSFALIVTVISLASSGADAVTCYKCNSALDTNCNDAFKAASSVGTCTGDSCFKVYGTYQGSSIVTRDCNPVGSGTQNGCNSYNLGGISGTICMCSGNQCNSAISSMVTGRATSVVVGLTAAVILMVSRLL